MNLKSNASAGSIFTNYYLLGAILSAVAVISPPLGSQVQTSFTAHMIQHITLMMITGPLLVLATPSTWHPTNKLFALLTHPILSWLLYAALMIGVHLPGPHDFIMMNSWAHNFIEVPLYLVIPYLFYFNLLDRNLTNRRVTPALSVISLFLMMVPETLTGFFIYVSNESLYMGMYPIDDQRRGGSFMWSGAMFIDVIWMSFAVYHWIKSEERKSIEVDAEIARDAKAAKHGR
jgi:cytochrome c oxidase assembly factor CtaG